MEWILWALAAALFFCVIIYNRLVGLRQARARAFSDVDVQLKQRHDLIPNLVQTVKGYAAHEKGVFEQVTEARATAMRGGTLGERAKAEAALGQAAMNLMAVAENYPQLKANDNFRQLQAELSDIENKIAAARRWFNNATSEYNTARQQFPAVLLADKLGFREETFFGLEEGERQAVNTPPKVDFN
jgi:LemA protein